MKISLSHRSRVVTQVKTRGSSLFSLKVTIMLLMEAEARGREWFLCCPGFVFQFISWLVGFSVGWPVWGRWFPALFVDSFDHWFELLLGRGLGRHSCCWSSLFGHHSCCCRKQKSVDEVVRRLRGMGITAGALRERCCAPVYEVAHLICATSYAHVAHFICARMMLHTPAPAYDIALLRMTLLICTTLHTWA